MINQEWVNGIIVSYFMQIKSTSGDVSLRNSEDAISSLSVKYNKQVSTVSLKQNIQANNVQYKGAHRNGCGGL